MIRSLRLLLILFPAFSLLLTILSCSQDYYEKGEGKYSLMRGDFAEAQVDQAKQIVSILTDDGELLPLVKPETKKWTTTADTIYRCMLYYNKVENDQGGFSADVISIGQVPCPEVKLLKDFDKELRTDPVKFESIWLSRSGKYLNLFLQLKTGTTEDTSAVQSLAVICDTIIRKPAPSSVTSDSIRNIHLTLHHDQGKVPEYYSTKVYLSIPTAALPADSVCLSMNTYNGPVVKTLSLRRK